MDPGKKDQALIILPLVAMMTNQSTECNRKGFEKCFITNKSNMIIGIQNWVILWIIFPRVVVEYNYMVYIMFL